MSTASLEAISQEETMKKKSQLGETWRRLRKNKLAMVGMIIVLLLIFLAIFADVIAPYDYAETDYSVRMQYPSAQHLLGTDNMGRDILSRVIYGGRVSLLVSLLAIVLSLIVGGAMGAVAGFFGGKVDSVIMRITDILQAIPGLMLAVAISALLGAGTITTAIAIAASSIAPSVRILRSTILSIREQEYVEAARATGSGSLRIILTQVLPNTLSPVIVDTSLRVGTNIMQISSLSFIGLGVQSPTAEWGSMLSDGLQYIRDFYPLILFPGLAIMLTMFGFNVFGDGLRDALDPRLKT